METELMQDVPVLMKDESTRAVAPSDLHAWIRAITVNDLFVLLVKFFAASLLLVLSVGAIVGILALAIQSIRG